VGPAGERIAKADDQPGILYAELDLAEILAARQRRPFLDLRRPDAFWAPGSRYQPG